MRDLFGNEVTEETIRKEIIENSNIPKIRRKYALLAEEVAMKNETKFRKISEEKLYYLHNDDDIDISDDVSYMYDFGKDEIGEVVDEFIRIYRYSGTYWREIENIRVFKLLLDTVIDIIYEEYYDLLDRKNIEEDEYFSNMDYVRVAEICELVEQCDNYFGEIYEIIFKITGKRLEGNYGRYFCTGSICCENIIIYLSWIFSDRTMEEQPYYIF